MTPTKNPISQEKGENITLMVKEKAHQGPSGNFQNRLHLKMTEIRMIQCKIPTHRSINVIENCDI